MDSRLTASFRALQVALGGMASTGLGLAALLVVAASQAAEAAPVPQAPSQQAAATALRQDQPDAPAAAARLMKNQEDIGAAVAGYYGKHAGDRLTALLKDHISIAVDIIKFAKAGDKASQQQANTKWPRNASSPLEVYNRLPNPDRRRRHDLEIPGGSRCRVAGRSSCAGAI